MNLIIKYEDHVARTEIAKIYKFADWDHDKSVSFLEFFSANVNYRQSITWNHLEYVFELIDENHNRYG